VENIYRANYWNAVAGDQWAVGLDLCVFDLGVNSGPAKALKIAHAAMTHPIGGFGELALLSTVIKDRVTVIKRYQARRLSFLQSLTIWRTFGRGWGRRVRGIEAIATKWALADIGLPPEVVKEKLLSEAAKAKVAARTSAVGTAAIPIASGAGLSFVQQVDWQTLLTGGGVGLAAVVPLAYLAYNYWSQALRAQAFQAVAK
jgi:lysozyme family protein